MSQLARKIRQRFTAEADFLEKFPGDMQPDMASPGVALPYLVVTTADSIPEYSLYGGQTHIVETVTIDVVAGTRSQAEDCLGWLRSKLVPCGWLAIQDDAWSVNYWRIGSHNDQIEIAVEGDDSATRTVSLTVIGSICAA